MIHVVILAGGKGTRMKSDLPKVLHEVKGKPIVLRLLESVAGVCKKPTLIVGHKSEEVIKATENKYNYAIQKDQLGTGHAVKCARGDLEKKKNQTIMVLPGDHPLVSRKTIRNLIAMHDIGGATITLGTIKVPNYEGLHSVFNNFGRIIRNGRNTVEKIVEYKDATDEERGVREVNLSYYCFNARWLWKNLDKITNENASGEYYLTDLVQIARDQGRDVQAFPITNVHECLGINTPEQLRMVEEAIDRLESDHRGQLMSLDLKAEKV